MRLFVQIWMILALFLVEKNVVKAADEDNVMYIDGSGDGGEPGNVAEAGTPDDEDNTEVPGEIGSGTVGPGTKAAGDLQTLKASVKLSFDNTIRITKIGNRRANFIETYRDPNSVESLEVFNQVCSVLTSSNQLTSRAESCVGVSITEGSLVVTTKLTFPEDTEATSAAVESAILESVTDQTALTVDLRSITVEPSISEPEGTEVVEPLEPATKPKPKEPDTPSPSRPNKGNQDNDIFFTATTDKPAHSGGNATVSNEINDVNHDNSLGVKNEKEKEQDFFEMILGNPVLLAALVGAVVLTLITIILIIMFMIYRVKKKDEGSYSLDEPHKVKDPTTYWKDTKEFYA
ncbi:syndecan-3-like isoform X2 [Acanthaster planci]|uniref:Syndecan-3-like isoform X2 n=1 Tax=Acanthaster planci TaxID=133434 RepID=A0A8B7ZMS9_ACAPL|nr:syndecan-3-like isoform X2 [Acanthaster planci]